jgi:hypothetical protein
MKRPAAARFLTLTLSVLALTFVGPQLALAHYPDKDEVHVTLGKRSVRGRKSRWR